MKVLVVSTPGGGHVTPLVPVIDALLAGGDEVVVASGPDAEPIVAKTGARFCVAGRKGGDYLARLAQETEHERRGIPPDRLVQFFLPRGFGRIVAPEMIDDVVRIGRAFAPDLIVHEAFALAAPLAADILDVPCVAHMFGPLPPDEAVQLANDAVAPMWQSHGREVPGWAGMYRDLTIQICPPSIDTASVPVGETMYERPTPLPLTPPVTTDCPVVYVSFGTLFNSNLDLFRFALEAMADEPVDVVATIGRDQDPAQLEPHPANARVERFIPQAELLPSCGAVVHHGGAGTMFGALAHGVPQVILPQGADNFEHAAICEQAGTAAVVRPDERTPERLTAAVRTVLHPSDYAVASRRCAEEIAAMPGPVEVAQALRVWVAAR